MTTYTPNAGFGLPSTGDRAYGPVIDGDFSQLDSMPPVGSLSVQTTEIPSATLNVKVSAGGYVRQDGTVGAYPGTTSKSLTASTTQKLYLDLTASGALVASTSWPTTAHVPVASVVVGSSTITSITDVRLAFTVAGSIVDGVNWTFGTSTGTQIGTAANQKIAFWGAAPVVQQTFGSKTAGTSYTTNEQTMLQDLWNLVRTLGLGS